MNGMASWLQRQRMVCSRGLGIAGLSEMVYLLGSNGINQCDHAKCRRAQLWKTSKIKEIKKDDVNFLSAANSVMFLVKPCSKNGHRNYNTFLHQRTCVEKTCKQFIATNVMSECIR